MIMKTKFLPLLLLACACSQHTANVRIVYSDGNIVEKNVKFKPAGGHLEYVVEKPLLKGIDTLSITPDFAVANAGEEGFFVQPDGVATYFLTDRKDAVNDCCSKHPLAMEGISTPRGSFIEIFRSYRFNLNIHTSLKDGTYTNTLQYILKDVEPYEDLVLSIYELKGKDATYSGMGRLYRKLFVEGRLQLLKDKAESRPLLKYAVESPEIRIRQAWKPVPTPVENQTRENEPAVRVKVTFDRVCDIVDALKKAGVDKSQLTLVGWHLKGHDGRFPTVFPPESTLGGEPALKHLISYAQDNGFQIVPHICTGDSYRVSEDFDERDLAVKRDGRYDCEFIYGSGRMFKLCNKVAYEKFVRPINDSLRAYGFRGIEYNDVYSIIPPVVCTNPNHPQNELESTEYVKRILVDGAEKIGGIASEGGYDHVIDVLDYALYVSMGADLDRNRLRDDYLPIWHIIYNGYIYSCPFSQSVNYPVKDPGVAMKIQEYGGHPTFYFYSAHRDDTRNWLGSAAQDLLCADEKELDTAVKAIRQGYDYLKEYGYIQYLTMEDHVKLADGIYKTTYSDGTVTICNYSDVPYDYDGCIVAAQNWLTVKGK